MDWGSRKWSRGARSGAGESEMDWGIRSGLHVTGIHLIDY